MLLHNAIKTGVRLAYIYVIETCHKDSHVCINVKVPFAFFFSCPKTQMCLSLPYLTFTQAARPPITEFISVRPNVHPQ